MNRLIKVCRLTLSFLAASFSSSNTFWFRSIPRFNAGIILPLFVKWDDMSCPLSALRAIDSADTIRFVLEAFFIQSLFRASRLPQRHEVIVFSIFITSHFKDNRIESAADPANRAILLWNLGALVKVIGMAKYLLGFLKTNSALRILSK